MRKNSKGSWRTRADRDEAAGIANAAERPGGRENTMRFAE
jgi:hypothetical protein